VLLAGSPWSKINFRTSCFFNFLKEQSWLINFTYLI